MVFLIHSIYVEKIKQLCTIALDIIHSAIIQYIGECYGLGLTSSMKGILMRKVMLINN